MSINGMTRGAWLRLVAQVLIVKENTISHVYRQALACGLIAPGPRGSNSPPLDLRERKDFLELVALCFAFGRTSGIWDNPSLPEASVRWDSEGLHAERLGGIRVLVAIPHEALSLLLDPDYS